MLPRTARPVVLVVDPDEDALELLGEYLQARGFDVLSAYVPDEAVALVRGLHVDVVLCEVGFGREGDTLIHAARTRATPAAVVAMAARPSVDVAVASMKAGAVDVLCKPLRLSQVYSAVQSALNQRDGELRARAISERLLFFEACVDLADAAGLPRLYGLLTQVARTSCEASEVTMWRPTTAGWTAVARGGHVSALADVDPAGLAAVDGVQRVGDLLWGRLESAAGVLYGVVAVAGGAERVASHETALARLLRVASGALERVDRRSRQR